MPVPADAPCVKGGAGLLGSISSIEREFCAAVVSWHTGTQTAVTHMASGHPANDVTMLSPTLTSFQ